MRCELLHNQSRGQVKEREVRVEKDRLCLTKIMIPPLACGSSEERMPDRD